MKALVTGGLGFVGSVLCKRLLELGHQVLIVDDGRVGLGAGLFDEKIVIREDIGNVDARLIRFFAPDVVMHLAAGARVEEGEQDPLGYLDNNLTKWGRFLSTLHESGVTRIIHSGTYAAYGIPQSERMKEDHPLAPMCWYGWTKLLAERLLIQLSKTHGLKYIGFRYGNVAGTGYGIVERRKKEEHLIPRALDAAVSGSKMTVYGTDYDTPDGTCIRDYVHVLDIAEAHTLGAEALVSERVENEIVNLGTGQGSSVLDVLREVSRVTGCPPEWNPGPRRNVDIPRMVLDCSKASAVLGWKSSRTLGDMVGDAWTAWR